MRVVHCVPIFSELTQTFVYELVRNLQLHDSDLDVHVLTWHRKHAAERPFDPVHIVSPPRGGEIRQSRVARGLPRSLERLVRPTRFERELSRRLRNIGAGLVHVHFGPTAVLIGRACRLAGVPMIVTFRGRDASAKLRKWHWRRLYRRTLSEAAAITCVSGDLKKQLAPVLPDGIPCWVIFGGKQPQHLRYRPPPPSRGRLLSIGRLIEKKGHHDAIKAVATARRRGADVSLTIIGEGPRHNALVEEIDRWQLGSAVTLTGPLPYEETVARMQQADVLVAASRTARNGDSEGIPNVIKEAQLIGLPVVATRHGGIPDAIPPDARQALVEEGDVEALAQRIAELTAMPPEALRAIAQAGHEYALKAFDPQAEVEAYRTLYDAIHHQATHSPALPVA